MKKTIIFFVFIMMISTVLGQTEPVLIQEQEQTQTTAGNTFQWKINPDHPLWGVDRAIDEIMVRMQFNEYNRAQMALQIAQERQEEVQEMLDKKDKANADKAAVDWEAKIKTAEEVRTRLRDQNKDQEADTLENNIQNRVQVLEQVRARLIASENPNDDHGIKGIDNALGNVKQIREENQVKEQAQAQQQEGAQTQQQSGTNGGSSGTGGNGGRP